MAPYSKYFAVELSGVLIAIVCAVYVYMKYVTFNYWSSKNVEYAKPAVVPVGSLWPVLSGEFSIGQFVRDKYLELKKNPVFGFYSFYKPTLVINDPDLIRLVLTKEFPHFHDRGIYCNEKNDPLSGHLFALPGTRWKFLRAKFSPTFTSSKMKQMFFTVKECSDTLVACAAEKAEKSELVEVKDLMARFSTDVIASTAFGIQCNSLQNPNAEFRKWGRKFFEPRPVHSTISAFVPQILNLLNIPGIDKDVTNFFINAFKETVEYRTANNVVRKDFLELIMQLTTKGYVENTDGTESEPLSEADNERITMLEGAAQAFVFWLAGFETSSSTATHCLYELAIHQEIQDKVAEEVNRVLQESEGITYESIKKMHYLDKVVSETLRKYPSLPVLNRECTKEFDLPGTGLRVGKGTPIIIPVYGLHSDPDIYPDPDKFDPERFNAENIASRHQYAYLPFGEGPRNCIGMRFGLVQTKVGLLSLLSKYRFKPGPDFKIPFQVDTGNFVLCPLGGITLRIENR